MKTEHVPTNRTFAYNVKEKNLTEQNENKNKPVEDSKQAKLIKEPNKRIELERSVINNPETVKQLMGDSVQWREMKFYQREEGGQYYIDIVDKATGNVLRTIPDTKFAEISEKYKQLSGLKIDING